MKIVKDWLQQMLGRLFQPISRQQALQIASEDLAQSANAGDLICHASRPSWCRNLYNLSSEPCWYIVAPWDDHTGGIELRSSRVILIGKLTGTIHYDGSAGDEG